MNAIKTKAYLKNNKKKLKKNKRNKKEKKFLSSLLHAISHHFERECIEAMNKEKNEYAMTSAVHQWSQWNTLYLRLHPCCASARVWLVAADGYWNLCDSFSANVLLPLGTRICSSGCCKLMQQ